MIYKNNLTSILEAIYLKEPVTSKFGKSTIVVNPGNLDYILGRTVIFNTLRVPMKIVKGAVEHSKAVISRVKFGDPYIDRKVDFQPYIMRIDPDIMWDGQRLGGSEGDELMDLFGNIDSLPDSNDEVESPEISIPKVLGLPREDLRDREGNLTCFGWALHQVGVNLMEDTRFRDLDLIKTWKVY